MKTQTADTNSFQHLPYTKYKKTLRIRKKYTRTLYKIFISQMHQSIMQRLYNMSIEQTLSKSKTNSTKTRFQWTNLCFNHRISFDTKGPISSSSEGNSYIMVLFDAFTHYVALNPVPHCNAYYAYTTLYEH